MSVAADQPSAQPNHDLDFAEDNLPDDDPDVVEGMRRLAELRATEDDVPIAPRAAGRRGGRG